MTFARFPDRPPVRASVALVYVGLVAGCLGAFVLAWYFYRIVNPG